MIVVSGRPLQIDPAQLNETDALVAAWLPGSEGKGVSDTLFGRKPYTGKLPVTWPKTVGAGADQRRRRELPPAVSVRLGAADPLGIDQGAACQVAAAPRSLTHWPTRPRKCPMKRSCSCGG